MIREIVIESEKGCIPVEVIRSSRKTLGLEIKDACVKARVPNRLTDKEIEQFVYNHKAWIEDKLIKQKKLQYRKREVNAAIPPVQQLSDEQKNAIIKKFDDKVRYFAQIMGLTYGRITIRNQKTRWGSCSSKGNLNFNYKLYFFKEELMDYVIIHELAHRRYMNHSEFFWAEVSKYCPEYKRLRNELKRYEIQ